MLLAMHTFHCNFLLPLITGTLIIDNGGPKVRNLSGGKATNGNNETNQDILRLVTTPILKGYAIQKVDASNDRIYLSRYRRNYWLGTRYYWMDNLNYSPTRDSCLYHLDSEERENLKYTDGSSIYNVVYQCQRYVQYCCGLNCCLDESTEELNALSPNRKIFGPRNKSQIFRLPLYFLQCFIFELLYLNI